MARRADRAAGGRHTARLQAGNFEARLSGKAMMMTNSRSPAEQEHFVDEFRAWRAQADAEYRARRDALLLAIAPYRSLALLGHIYFKETVANPETYKEWQHGGVAAKVEHFTLLLLSRDADGTEDVVSDNVVGAIHEYLETLFVQLPLFYDDMKEGGSPTDPDPRSLVLMWELGIRMPLYVWQHRTTLRELFAPMTDWMLAELGFTIDDALAVELAFEHLTNAMLAREHPQLVAGMREVHSVMTSVEGRLLPKQGQEAAATRIWADFQRSWSETMARIGDGIAVTAEAIALEAGIDVTRVEAVLNFFVTARDLIPTDYYVPIPDSPLKLRPIVSFEKRWALPSSMLMLPAMQPAIERALNPGFGPASADMDAWNVYEKRRSEIVEARAAAALSKLLDGAVVHRNLKYKVPGHKQPFELDGLAITDGQVILLECKGGAFSSAAKRGDLDAIEGRIEALVTDAHNQGIRALEYIDATEQPTFRTDSQTIVIDKADMRRAFLVTVTLEELGFLTASFNEVDRVKAGSLASTPWVVPLHDLELVAKYIGSGPEFIHYLQRRVALNAQPMLRAFDELDWLGRYFYDALSFAEVKEFLSIGTMGTASLISHKTAFDDFEHYENGIRLTPAPRPQSDVHTAVRRIVAGLTRWGGRGYIDAGVALLDLPHKLQLAFVKRVARNALRVRPTQCLEEVATTSDGAMVFACTVCGSAVEASRLAQLPDPTVGETNVHLIIDATYTVRELRLPTRGASVRAGA